MTDYVRTALINDSGEYNFTKVPVSITNDAGTYLAGYTLQAHNIPKDAVITNYYANGGQNDSKLNSNMMIEDPVKQKDDYIIVAGSASKGIDSLYLSYGYDLTMGIIVDDMNAGVYFKDDSAIGTGDTTDYKPFVWITLLSFGLAIVLLPKRKKKTCSEK